MLRTNALCRYMRDFIVPLINEKEVLQRWKNLGNLFDLLTRFALVGAHNRRFLYDLKCTERAIMLSNVASKRMSSNMFVVPALTCSLACLSAAIRESKLQLQPLHRLHACGEHTHTHTHADVRCVDGYYAHPDRYAFTPCRPLYEFLSTMIRSIAIPTHRDYQERGMAARATPADALRNPFFERSGVLARPETAGVLPFNKQIMDLLFSANYFNYIVSQLPLLSTLA
jgi:hypothetical protein